jgi:hypothetical protein
MQIPTINPNVLPSSSQQQQGKTDDATRETRSSSSVITSHFKVDDSHLKLVYQAALDKLNEILAPDLGENAIQKVYKEGLDVSPEATAERIVNLSTALFDRYSEVHSDKNENEVFSRFMNVIREGIEQGFQEARDILSGLNVLEGSIKENVDKTYELVQQKLDIFEQQFQEKKEQED